MVGNWMTRAPSSAKRAALSLACSRARVIEHRAAEQRFALEPVQLAAHRDHLADNDYRRVGKTLAYGIIRQSADGERQGSADDTVVPQWISAAGVSGDIPAEIRSREISGRFFMPMTKTRVEALRASASESCTDPGFVGSSCPVMSVTEDASVRWVRGMPA